MKKYGFGADIGGTTCKIGLFKESGALIEKWEIRTNTTNNGEQILKDVTGEDFNPQYYVDYLIEKYSKIYGV